MTKLFIFSICSIHSDYQKEVVLDKKILFLSSLATLAINGAVIANDVKFSDNPVVDQIVKSSPTESAMGCHAKATHSRTGGHAKGGMGIGCG